MSSISSVASAFVGAQNSGVNALTAANQRLNADAQQIADPNSSDVTAPLLDLNQALILAEAGANVISTENRMMGALLNAFA
jgi:hypothetical protein